MDRDSVFSIAKAPYKGNPRVIVLDEATSALDRYIRKAYTGRHSTILQKTGTTFIVVHRLSTSKDADKIAVIS